MSGRHFVTGVPNIVSSCSTSSRLVSSDPEFCVVDGPKKGYNVGQVKMANAMKAVRSEKMGLKKKTSKEYEVPSSTLKDKANSKQTDTEKLINKRLDRKAVLPNNLEEELVSYCILVDSKFFGPTTSSFKLMTFELAIKMVLPVRFRHNKEQKAGSDSVTLCAAIFD